MRLVVATGFTPVSIAFRDMIAVFVGDKRLFPKG